MDDKRGISAASAVCPVVHTTLNWLVTALLLAVLVAIGCLAAYVRRSG
jgi:hypothetical protein